MVVCFQPVEAVSSPDELHEIADLYAHHSDASPLRAAVLTFMMSVTKGVFDWYSSGFRRAF